MDQPGEPTRPQDDSDPWQPPQQAGEGGAAVPPSATPPYAGADMLGSGGPAEPEQGKGPARGRRVAIAAVAAVAVAAIGGGAYAVGTSLSGGGTQPEDVLPAGAFAFAKIDFDPAANQKLAVYQLSKKFPDLADLTDDEDTALKDILVGAMVDASDSDVDYEQDVKPWLGDRAGLAVYPPAEGEDEPTFAIAVQYTDEDGVREALKDGDEDVDWVTSDGYVVVGDGEGSAQRLVDQAAEEALTDQDSYRDDVDTLEGSQISVVWADIGAGYTAVKDAAGEAADEFTAALGSTEEPTGRMAFGLRADSDYLELQGRTFALAQEYFTADTAPSSENGTGLVTTLPADAVAALSVTGLGDGLVQLWDELAGATGDAEEITAAAEQMGLTLPDDLKAVFGDETAVSLSGDLTAFSGEQPDELPAVTIASRGADAERSEQISTMLNEGLTGTEGALEANDGTVVFGNDPDAVSKVAAGEGGLGDTEAFRTAVPDAADAGFVMYVDLGRILDEVGEVAGDDEDLARVNALSGLGFSASGGVDAEMRLRLTVR